MNKSNNIITHLIPNRYQEMVNQNSIMPNIQQSYMQIYNQTSIENEVNQYAILLIIGISKIYFVLLDVVSVLILPQGREQSPLEGRHRGVMITLTGFENLSKLDVNY